MSWLRIRKALKLIRPPSGFNAGDVRVAQFKQGMFKLMQQCAPNMEQWFFRRSNKHLGELHFRLTCIPFGNEMLKFLRRVIGHRIVCKARVKAALVGAILMAIGNTYCDIIGIEELGFLSPSKWLRFEDGCRYQGSSAQVKNWA